MCTLCRSLTQPEMEYDCENARYNQPGVRTPPGLSISDQKVGSSLWEQTRLPPGAASLCQWPEAFPRGCEASPGASLWGCAGQRGPLRVCCDFPSASCFPLAWEAGLVLGMVAPIL